MFRLESISFFSKIYAPECIELHSYIFTIEAIGLDLLEQMTNLPSISIFFGFILIYEKCN